MANITIDCYWCKKSFWKRIAEYNRSIRLGRKHLCSLSCSGSYSNSLDKNKGRGLENLIIGGKGKDNPNWKGGITNSESSLRSRTKYPERHKARTKMQKAVEKGILIRPSECEDCNKTCKPNGHHEDYSKPLEVNWVCRECHEKRDKRMREEGRL